MPMDETLAVAAVDLSGRPHAVVDLEGARCGWSATCRRELVHDFFEASPWRARQRARQGAVRPLEPSPDRSGVQGVRPRAARGLREGRAAGEDAAEHEGAAVIALVDYGAGNLTSVRKALDAARRGVRRRRRRRPSCDGARGVIVPGVGHFAATARSTSRGATRSPARSRAGTPLLGICVGMQWLFEGSDEAPGRAAASASCRAGSRGSTATPSSG